MTVKAKLNTKIKIGSYPFEVIFTDNQISYNKECKKLGVKGTEGEYGGLCMFDKETLTFIIMITQDDFYILCHELEHLSIYLFDCIGHDILPNGSEPVCYLYDSLLKIAVEAYGFKITRPKPRKIIKRKIKNEINTNT